MDTIQKEEYPNIISNDILIIGIDQNEPDKKEAIENIE